MAAHKVGSTMLWFSIVAKHVIQAPQPLSLTSNVNNIAPLGTDLHDHPLVKDEERRDLKLK